MPGCAQNMSVDLTAHAGNQESVMARAVLQHRVRWRLVAAVAFLVISTSACSGGSGGSTSAPTNSGGSTPAPTTLGTVTVTVKDAFGAPVAGAAITMYRNSGAGLDRTLVADNDGRAEFKANDLSGLFGASASVTDLYGVSYEPKRPANDRLDFAITLHPAADLTGGIANLSVIGGGDSDDGRSLEFKVRLIVVAGNTAWDLEDWNLGAVTLLPCAADCVEGPAGFDASYVGSVVARSWVPPGPKTTPLALSLLLDQGGSMIVNDPADRRLLAAKYLQTRLDPSDQIVVAAFASDDPSSGQAALLANQPLTIFPVDSPRFTPDGRGYFSTINSLAALEGGASPLYAAIEELIDFTAKSAPADARRAIVALSSGDDESCVSRDPCWSAQEALREKSASTGVQVVTVALADPAGRVDQKTLALFAHNEGGAAIWARDPKQVPTIFGRLPAILDGRHGAIDVTIQLQSPVRGAFASGQIVAGMARVEVCPWDCDQSVDIPFAVRIP
jgi:hypothetical protein